MRPLRRQRLPLHLRASLPPPSHGGAVRRVLQRPVAVLAGVQHALKVQGQVAGGGAPGNRPPGLPQDREPLHVAEGEDGGPQHRDREALGGPARGDERQQPQDRRQVPYEVRALLLLWRDRQEGDGDGRQLQRQGRESHILGFFFSPERLTFVTLVKIVFVFFCCRNVLFRTGSNIVKCESSRLHVFSRLQQLSHS